MCVNNQLKYLQLFLAVLKLWNLNKNNGFHLVVYQLLYLFSLGNMYGLLKDKLTQSVCFALLCSAWEYKSHHLHENATWAHVPIKSTHVFSSGESTFPHNTMRGSAKGLSMRALHLAYRKQGHLLLFSKPWKGAEGRFWCLEESWN